MGSCANRAATSYTLDPIHWTPARHDFAPRHIVKVRLAQDAIDVRSLSHTLTAERRRSRDDECAVLRPLLEPHSPSLPGPEERTIPDATTFKDAPAESIAGANERRGKIDLILLRIQHVKRLVVRF